MLGSKEASSKEEKVNNNVVQSMLKHSASQLCTMGRFIKH